ncbi:MAG TPA: deoxyribonuclease IV [Streptosporangiaceae bacterium]|jgi:deoxyribonuclease-4|nr:deoxyribonuclease IV [Streptosporangiaceae bacterium]
MTSIGAHVHREDPFAAATGADAAVAQFFLGDPQAWKAPVFPGDPAAVRDAFAEAGIEVFIHAPYRINVATANNRIRIPSRKLLGQHLEAAAAVGAKGLVVHGGHVDAGVDQEVGYENWQKAVERIERPVPMLIENTAGGDRAMARGLDALGRLWEAIAAGLDDNIGFCLDTCHAFAGGEDLDGIVDRVKAVTGRIDLVHCNNSRDEQGSGRDRHAGLTDGTIDPAQLLDVVRASGAPIVCETPDPATDIRWLRDHLTA